MVGNRRGPRAFRSALVASAILGAVPLLFTRARRRAQSAGRRQGRSPQGHGQGQGEEAGQGSRPSRSTWFLHGPADRRRHVVGRCRLAVPAGADRGRATRGDARRPEDPQRRDRGRHRRRGRLSQHPTGSPRRSQGDGLRHRRPARNAAHAPRQRPEAGVANIKPVRSTQNDTGLPKEAIDLILMVNVYHECSDPEAILQGL